MNSPTTAAILGSLAPTWNSTLLALRMTNMPASKPTAAPEMIKRNPRCKTDRSTSRGSARRASDAGFSQFAPHVHKVLLVSSEARVNPKDARQLYVQDYRSG